VSSTSVSSIEKAGRILISAGGNVTRIDGTTIRAQRVYDVLKKHYHTELRGHKGFSTDMPGIKFLVLFPYWFIDYLYTIFTGRFDYIYCSNNRFGFLIFKSLKFLFRYKLIYEAHSLIAEEFKYLNKPAITVKGNQMLERFIARNADFVVALSRKTHTFFSESNTNVALIPVFIDTSLFAFDKEKRKSIREKYGLGDNYVAGLIGPFNIVFNKHYLTFLQKYISDFADNLRFLVIGKCNERSDNPRIVYTGYVEDYAGVLAALDCVLVPADFPTGGPRNKVLEAMSVGLPVYTTPSGAANIEYAQSEDGLIVLDEKDIVSTLNTVSGNPQDNDRRKRTRLVIEKHYSCQSNEKELLKVFEICAKTGLNGRRTR